MNICKGDLVIITKGKDKDKTGKVIKVFPKENRLIIEALNLVKKIKKAKKQGEKGEIISVPRPINRANVMLICPHCKKPTKIASKEEGKKKVRICKKCVSVVS
ncbi:MAG: 50S ribosomal protein L24 [Candidatus Paceibacterota bacterium]|jgi:large subunit ribosomal protein L24